LRVQIIYMLCLVRTGREIMSDSKLTCYLTIEKNLSFCLTLVSLRKVKALGGKNQNKTTPSLTEVLQLKLSSLVR